MRKDGTKERKKRERERGKWMGKDYKGKMKIES